MPDQPLTKAELLRLLRLLERQRTLEGELALVHLIQTPTFANEDLPQDDEPLPIEEDVLQQPLEPQPELPPAPMSALQKALQAVRKMASPLLHP